MSDNVQMEATNTISIKDSSNLMCIIKPFLRANRTISLEEADKLTNAEREKVIPPTLLLEPVSQKGRQTTEGHIAGLSQV